MKNLVNMSVVVAFLGVTILASTASAEIFEGTGFYEMQKSDSLDYAKEQAKLFAERRALEEAYVNIGGMTESENGLIVIDEIIAESEGIISVLETKYKIESGSSHDSFIIRAVVKVEIDLENLRKYVKNQRQ